MRAVMQHFHQNFTVPAVRRYVRYLEREELKTAILGDRAVRIRYLYRRLWPTGRSPVVRYADAKDRLFLHWLARLDRLHEQAWEGA